MVSQRSESQLLIIAQQLLNATRERSFFAQMRDQMRWDDKLLAVAMENPGLRVQLFRLIDCLPSLRSKTEVARHLQEYLSDPAVELPGFLKNLLNFANPDSLPGQLAAGTMETAIELLARRYVAGENLKQALKTIEGLRKDKLGFTIDLLGEAVITEAEAQSYLDRYLGIMEELAAAAQKWNPVPSIDLADGQLMPRVQVTVKLTAFYSQFDPLDPSGSKQNVCDRIRVLLRRAKDLSVSVHFDMEQYAYKSLTLQILKELLMEPEFRSRTDVGLTLQAYLHDTEADLRDLLEWLKQRTFPLTIRLVKGAYWDQETIKARQKHWECPVYQNKPSTDANFERLTRILLENHTHVYSAIASHNIRSIAVAIALAQQLKVPRKAFELQVLFGMADRLARTLAQQGHRVRVYCPYGELIPGMAYLIRRLLENTANSSFLRQSLQDVDPVQLLATPELKEPDPPAPPEPGSGFHPVADTDFSTLDLQQPFFLALFQVKQQLGKTYWPLINGELTPTPEIVDSLNPANPEECVGRIGMASEAQALAALTAAKAAQPGWKNTSPSERARILRQAGELLHQKRAELSAWMVVEVGKPWREADAEVSEAVDFCRYYAAEMERLGQPQNRDVAGETNRYHYQPRGLAVVIAPWNFPLAIATGMTAAALVSGNCTILKPAEQSSVVAAKLADILVQAGFPQGVFQFLPGVGEVVGPTLVQHPDVHLIAFTGSLQVGCKIYADAAKVQPGQWHLKRVIAEMGGKNAILIDESADLDQAVQGVVQSAFGFSGQKCSACSRVIVLESVYETFLHRLVEATRSLAIGPTEHPASRIGPVIDAEARDRIQSVITQAKQQFPVALEMQAPTPGYFIGPVIFSDVDPESSLAQEEIFGPVLAVIRASTFPEALALANATRYGLTGGLYSRTPSHIEQAQTEFAVGNLYINRGITGALVDRQAFGGFKLSGIGSKAGGPDYLLQFMEPRLVTENIQRQGFAPIEGVD